MKVIFFWTFIAKSSWNISKDNIIITIVNISFYYHLTRERAAHFLLLYPRFLFLLSVWQFAQETHLFQFTWFFIRSVPLFLPAWDPLLLLKHSLSTFFIPPPPPLTMSLFCPLTPLTLSFTLCLSEEGRHGVTYEHLLSDFVRALIFP